MAFKSKAGLVTSGGVASAQLFAANPGRLYLEIWNLHATQDLFVNFGTADASSTNGIKIAAGAGRRWGEYQHDAVPGDAIQVIGSGATTSLWAVEGDGSKIS